MLYHGAQRVKLPNLSKISRLLSPLTIFLRFQTFERYMISDVVFWWKVASNFGHFAATLIRYPKTDETGNALKFSLYEKYSVMEFYLTVVFLDILSEMLPE